MRGVLGSMPPEGVQEPNRTTRQPAILPVMISTYERSRDAIRRQIESISAMQQRIGGELFVANPAISGWSPGEHLDHIAKAAASVLRQMSKNEPIGVPSISWIGRLVLTIGWIPRGKGRSPEKVRGAVVAPAEIESAFRELGALLDALPREEDFARGRPLVKHPVFRGLTAAQALRFVVVHNDHHLRIIDDIVRPG
jgi:hypothetical protein